MKENRKVKLKIYGFSEKELSIELSDQIPLFKVSEIFDSIFKNTILYFQNVLQLNSRNLFVFSQGFFYRMKSFCFR